MKMYDGKVSGIRKAEDGMRKWECGSRKEGPRGGPMLKSEKMKKVRSREGEAVGNFGI
jgi:hypothetical protein